MNHRPFRRGRSRRRAAGLAGCALLAYAAATPAADGWMRCRRADGSERLVRAELARSFPMAMGSCRSDDPPRPLPAAAPAAFARAPQPTVDVWVVTAPARPVLAGGRRPPPPPEAFVPWLQDAERRIGVSRTLLTAVMFVESGYNPHARSDKGAIGLMQVMPQTARRFGVEDSRQLLDPRVNIEVGARYLRTLMEMFSGRLDLVVAAYNAGEGAVQRSGNRVPPYDETQDYVRKVLMLL
jgi:soluble lytic murein transglycosylase-like protein